MTFEAFVSEVRGLLEPTAAGKGYNASGVDGPNDLYEFVQTMSGGHQHALGEIVYKARRYAAKGNREDVLKIAAWAFLILKHEMSEPCIQTSDKPKSGTIVPNTGTSACECSGCQIFHAAICSAQGDGDDGA